MNLRLIVILFLAIISSCKKQAIEADIITIEGVVKDEASKEPIAGIVIKVDGIKSPSGMGIITDGKRKAAGRTSTDANGYYKITLTVFKEAERLEFYLNPANLKEGYVEDQQNINLSNINKSDKNKVDFTLSPTSVLKIKFKNANPVSDADFFHFSWLAKNGHGSPKGLIQKENCGSVTATEALTWTGKDVCGIFTAETFAEKYIYVYWSAKKSGIIKQYLDSVFVKRGMVNEFYLNY